MFKSKVKIYQKLFQPDELGYFPFIETIYLWLIIVFCWHETEFRISNIPVFHFYRYNPWENVFTKTTRWEWEEFYYSSATHFVDSFQVICQKCSLTFVENKELETFWLVKALVTQSSECFLYFPRSIPKRLCQDIATPRQSHIPTCAGCILYNSWDSVHMALYLNGMSWNYAVHNLTQLYVVAL